MTLITPTDQSSDHDSLIRLESKVDQVLMDVKDLKDGLSARLTRAEEKIFALEKVHDETNVFEVAKITRDNAHWINDFKLTWKIILAIVVVASGALGTLLANAVNIMRIIHVGQ